MPKSHRQFVLPSKSADFFLVYKKNQTQLYVWNFPQLSQLLLGGNGLTGEIKMSYLWWNIHFNGGFHLAYGIGSWSMRFTVNLEISPLFFNCVGTF